MYLVLGGVPHFLGVNFNKGAGGREQVGVKMKNGTGPSNLKWFHFAILSTFYKYKFITSVGFLITGDTPYVSLSLCRCSAFFKAPLSTFFLSSLCSCASVFSFQLFYYHMVVMKYCLPHFLFQCLAIFFQLSLSDLLNKRKKKKNTTWPALSAITQQYNITVFLDSATNPHSLILTSFPTTHLYIFLQCHTLNCFFFFVCNIIVILFLMFSIPCFRLL